MITTRRIEVRELHMVREAFMSRFGREWAISVMDNTFAHVSPRILSKCKTGTPDKEWVELYLFEIAKTYQLAWRPEGMLVDVDGAGKRELLREPDTAAQEQRLMEAELAGTALKNGGEGQRGSQLPSAAASTTASHQDEPAHDENDEDNDDDGDGDGDCSLLPTVPSAAPTLGSVRKSTSSVPIIPAVAPPPSSVAPISKSDGDEASHNAAEEGTTPSEAAGMALSSLPPTPPLDPAQAARTVVIKSMSPKTTKTADLPGLALTSATVETPSPGRQGGDSSYDVSWLSLCVSEYVWNQETNEYSF